MSSGSRWIPIKLVAMVMAIGLVSAACGGGAVAPSASSTAGAGASAAPGALPKPELTTLRIGLSAPSEPAQYAEELALQLGLYQKYGLQVEVTGFEGDAKALQALVAGKLDMYVAGSSSTINTVITDTPLKLISMNGIYISDGFFCGKDIKTAADVKGKIVAVSTFGGTSHGSVLLSLKQLGLKPTDVTIREVGGESSRLAALRSGAIACAPLEIIRQKELAPLGFNVLVDIQKAKLQWGRSGLAARADWLQKYPNTALVVAAAVLEANNSMWTDPETAAKKFTEFTQSKPEDALLRIKDWTTIGSRSMTFTEEAFIAPRDVLATVNPAVANVDVKKAFDISFLNKLKDIGFYAKIGAPTSD